MALLQANITTFSLKIKLHQAHLALPLVQHQVQAQVQQIQHQIQPKAMPQLDLRTHR